MRKIRSKSLFAFLLVLPLVFGGCSDSVDMKCTDSNTIHINQDCRDFFYFKPGTWWLYEQEGTGNTDSIWVSEATIEWDNRYNSKRNCKCGYGKCTEKAWIVLQNRVHNDSDRVCSYVIAAGLQSEKNTINGSAPGFRIGFSPLDGFWEYQGNLILVNKNSEPAVFESLDALTVNGKLYREILHKYRPSNEYGQSWLHEVWFARNFFIIRYTRFDNTTWNLIDYNIIQ